MPLDREMLDHHSRTSTDSAAPPLAIPRPSRPTAGASHSTLPRRSSPSVTQFLTAKTENTPTAYGGSDTRTATLTEKDTEDALAKIMPGILWVAIAIGAVLVIIWIASSSDSPPAESLEKAIEEQKKTTPPQPPPPPPPVAVAPTPPHHEDALFTPIAT